MPTEWHESYTDRVEGLPPSILRDLEKRCRTKGRGRVEAVPDDTPLDGLEHPRIEQAVNDVVAAYSRKKERSARDAAKKRQSRRDDTSTDVPCHDPEPPSLEPLSISVPPASAVTAPASAVDLTCHETIESAAGHHEEEDASEAETEEEDMPARTVSAVPSDVPSLTQSVSSRRERVGIFRVGTAQTLRVADEKKAEPPRRSLVKSRSSIFAAGR
jgi:hypothetical protein